MTELVNAEVNKENNTIPTQEIQKNQNEIQGSTNAEQKEESPQDRDWRKWRENRQKEREEAQKINEARIKAEQEAEALRKALEAVVNKPSVQSRASHYDETISDNELEESEEARIDRRVAEALKKKEMELENQRKLKEQQEYPEKLRSTFKDFDQICSPENLDYLEYHHPVLSKSLGRMPQGFDKWADIYNAIKTYIPNPESKQESKKAERNLQKPQALSHTVISEGKPAYSSYQEIEARRNERWQEMQKLLKGIG